MTSTLPERSLSPSAVLDARRLAALVEGLAAGTEAVPPRRARAVDEWTGRWCAALRAHAHDDGVLELIDEVRRGTRAVVSALLARPATVATTADFARMRNLARRLHELADALEVGPSGAAGAAGADGAGGSWRGVLGRRARRRVARRVFGG